MTMGESRTELLAWLNELTQLGVPKVESCGTGAAHCVIMDSVFRDVPLSKVKFNAKHEYEYVANFKVLQSVFDKHKIENAIPVERLIKCRFQDNLEFLQWVKKFWDQYYPGGTYDALARRKGSDAPSRSSLVKPPSKSAMTPVGVKKSSSNGSVDNIVAKPAGRKLSAATSSARAAAAAGPNTLAGQSLGSGSSGAVAGSGAVSSDVHRAELVAEYQKMTNEMTQQITELKVTVEQAERERDFYFGKLREIEMYIQSQLETGGVDARMEESFKEIQAVMYRTEDGFEIPENAEDVAQTF